MAESISEFTRFEIARIIGARALQISMDAPLLIKISEAELEVMHYDALKIAEKEFKCGALPISVRRPMPLKTGAKLKAVRDDSMDDEAEIAEKAEEMGLVNERDNEDSIIEDNSSGSDE